MYHRNKDMEKSEIVQVISTLVDALKSTKSNGEQILDGENEKKTKDKLMTYINLL